MALTLGGVLFTGFEVPEHINFGGAHALHTHKLPGGARVIDAMGRDDDPIAWSGRFRGGLAAFRARSLDSMRIAGRPVALAWGGFRFTVVVAEFRAEYRQAYEIPYTISCVVVTGDAPAAAPGLADLLGIDLGRALGLAGPVNIASVAEAISGVQAAVSAAKSLKDGFRGGIPGILDSVTAAQAALGQAAAGADAAFALAGQPSTGASGFASGLLTQSNAMSQLDAIRSAAASVNNMGATIRSFAG